MDLFQTCVLITLLHKIILRFHILSRNESHSENKYLPQKMTPEPRDGSTCSSSLELKAGVLLLGMGSACPPDQGVPTVGTGHSGCWVTCWCSSKHRQSRMATSDSNKISQRKEISVSWWIRTTFLLTCVKIC